MVRKLLSLFQHKIKAFTVFDRFRCKIQGRHGYQPILGYFELSGSIQG